MSAPVPRDAEVARRGYTLKELMVISAAREINDGELVFVGMCLPMEAFLVARRTHAPHAMGLFENGLLRETPAAAPLHTMGDPSNIHGAMQCGQMLDVMSLLQQGRVDVGLLGTGEVDRFGNLNTVWGHRNDEMRRLPGSGGSCDIACLARRTVVLVPHDRDRLRERVDHITSPGYGVGNGWRRAQGLPVDTGPAVIITNLGVLRFGPDGEAYLASVHPGVGVEVVLSHTGWTLRVADELVETIPPSKQELAALRQAVP